MALIGIDLGTTNSLVSVWKDGEAMIIPDSMGELMVPSVVAVDKDGKVLVGKAAKEEELKNPDCCASNFKRFMGTEKKYYLGEKEFLPEELSALVLKRLKEMAEDYLGEEVAEVVISVPAYFNNEQRYATKIATELAGIYCERLLNEPSAAALARRRMNMSEEDEQYLLVFDFGGGTLDVSIVDCFENIVEIMTIAGDNHLGGTDFDQAIAIAFCEEKNINWEQMQQKQRKSLLYAAQKAKEALTDSDTAEVSFEWNRRTLKMELTTEKLFTIAKSLFWRIKNVVSKAVADSGLMLEDISEVLLAGGSSRMPAIQIFLSRLFDRDIITGKQPDLLIAKGLGSYTGIKSRQEDIRDIIMTDVCPFSLGTEIVGVTKGAPMRMCMMIERNSVLPSRVTKKFYTVYDYQEKVNFSIYQGESYNPSDNLLLEQFVIKVPKAPAGEESITLTFEYNINGILEITAVSDTTGETINREVVSGHKHMLVEQVAKKKDYIQEMQFLSKEEEERRAIQAMGERLYQETDGEVREYISRLLGYYNHELASHSLVRSRKAGKEVLNALLVLEVRLRADVFSENWAEFWETENSDEDE